MLGTTSMMMSVSRTGGGVFGGFLEFIMFVFAIATCAVLLVLLLSTIIVIAQTIVSAFKENRCKVLVLVGGGLFGCYSFSYFVVLFLTARGFAW